MWKYLLLPVKLVAMVEKVSVVVSTTPTSSWSKGAKKTRVPTTVAPQYLRPPVKLVAMVEKVSVAATPWSPITVSTAMGKRNLRGHIWGRESGVIGWDRENEGQETTNRQRTLRSAG